ncbi:TIR-like protein FxsC [Kitasatospora sp. NPDC049258]|uniref:TIR-like protein FxsC n=1 Tax=Kitasatospora sp. NPDC049258 TaxID=3155394 RepID=UPI0034402425
MSSETGGLDRLAALLTGLGLGEPGPVELAELLWLAARSAEAGADPEPEPAAPAGEDGRDHDGTGAGGTGGDSWTAAGGKESAPTRASLHLPSDDPADRLADAAPVAAASPPMLARPLMLQRALRPLKRRVPHPRRRLLDEAATADRLAEALRSPRPEGRRQPAALRWLPVLRPDTERWLDVHLVLDCGPTMAIWRPLARELRAVLQQTGAFRTVVTARLGAAGTLGDCRPTDGRSAVLVLSDCMGPQWRPGPAGDRWHRTLLGLARRVPVAVVQPLPERLWPLAAVPAAAGEFTAAEAGQPAVGYGFAPVGAGRPPGTVALPVLEPSADWLANWAQLVGSPTGGRVFGAALLVGANRCAAEGEQGPEPDRLTAEELVLRFRSTASREAFALAGLTALTTPALPVMRLLQRAGFARPQPQHLAEIVVSGLLREQPGRQGYFDFRAGVREVLLGTVPRSTAHQAIDLLTRIGGELTGAPAWPAAGRAAFPALAPTDRGGVAALLEQRPFALVDPEALQLLGARAGTELRPFDAPSAPVERHDAAGHDPAGHDAAGHDAADRDAAGHDAGGRGAQPHGPAPHPPLAAPAAEGLPDPERSRAVLLLTTSRLDAREPRRPDEYRALRELAGLAEALADPYLVGMDRRNIWLGEDDPEGFLRALRRAAQEAEDALIVHLGGPAPAVAAEPGQPAVERPGAVGWQTVAGLVAGSGAAKRLLILDGFTEPSAEPAPTPAVQVDAHLVMGVRDAAERSVAGCLAAALRLGDPSLPREVTASQVISMALFEQPAPSFGVREPEGGRSFPLSRNAALPIGRGPVAGPPSHSGTRRRETQPLETPRPYFFLSYSRGAAADRWVEQLFDDLSEEVLQLTDLPAAVPAGFADRGAELDSWARWQITEALAGCRVFVPLCSPRYFADERCGREWYGFARRAERSPRAAAGWSSGIVPVQWQPTEPALLPDPARRLGLEHGGSGADQQAGGLYSLLRTGRGRGQYELTVHRLAVRIVQVAHETRIPAARPLSWESLENAFATSPPPGS